MYHVFQFLLYYATFQHIDLVSDIMFFDISEKVQKKNWFSMETSIFVYGQPNHYL